MNRRPRATSTRARSRRTHVVAGISLLATIALGACAGSSGGSGAPSPASSPAATERTNADTSEPRTQGEPTATSAAASDGAVGESDTTAGPTTTVPPAPTLPRPSYFAHLGTVELLAPAAADVGDSPVLEWAPVAGAAAYRLSVTGPGGTMWAWEGPETSVRYGGLEDAPPAGYAGTRLTEPGWWSIAAIGADGAVLAISDARAVSPDGRSPEVPVVTTTTVPAGPVPLDPTATDPCDLLSVAEAVAALGGEVTGPDGFEGQGGRYRSCDFARVDDDFLEFSVSINDDPSSYDPEGWTRGEIVPVEGLGEQSYISTDFGVRIGFVRSGAAISVVAPIDPATAPTWIELAKLIDQRILGQAALPG